MSLTPLTAELQPSHQALALTQAYEQCRQITRQHARTFYLSAHLLPAPMRIEMLALYAFCRLTDDIVDRPQAQPQLRLRQWRLAARLRPEQQSDPVMLAWSTVRDRRGIPQLYADELIDGVEQDLTRRRYDTFEELRRYCYLVASTVGLMSMYVIGFSDQRAFGYAIKLGIALQLTNILRDIGEDAANGRIYLPREELERFGYTEQELLEGRITPAFRQLMEFQIERADALYREGLPGIALLHPGGRFAITAAIQLYRGILGAIRANGYNVFSRRAHVSTANKLTRLPGLWLQSRALTPAPLALAGEGD